MEGVLGSHWFWAVVRVTVKRGVNKYNHPIQNPLLLVTEPQTHDILVSEVVGLHWLIDWIELLDWRLQNKLYYHTVSHAAINSWHYLSLFPVAPTLGHRASVKRFVSLQFFNSKTVGRSPRMGDQPVARPLPLQTQTNIHALSGIRTHDPSVRASEDNSCLRRRGHCDRRDNIYSSLNIVFQIRRMKWSGQVARMER
jgi:hypothetical protein